MYKKEINSRKTDIVIIAGGTAVLIAGILALASQD
jgi:hypothetical protein